MAVCDILTRGGDYWDAVVACDILREDYCDILGRLGSTTVTL